MKQSASGWAGGCWVWTGYGLGMDSGLGKGEAFRMVGWWGLSLKGGFED